MSDSHAAMGILADTDLALQADEDPAENSLRGIALGEANAVVVPATILGVNLEMSSWSTAGLLSNRLDNPKFCGPANEKTGLAAGWQPHGAAMGEVHNQLIRGMFLSGDESQLVNCYAKPGGGLVQTGVAIRKGETLVVELWAKVRHHPVTLEISLRPLPSRAPEYCKAEITVDTAYWKCFRAELTIGHSDPEATFYLVFKERGVVLFDQIQLRPVDEPLTSKAAMEAIANLGMSTLRYPGGCTSTNYHWKLGTGPGHLRPTLPDPVFKERVDYEFGISEYLEMCLSGGTTPYITVNVGTGTPDDAGEWARYCLAWYEARGIDAPEIYFQIGNEHYGVWESAHMTAAMYVDALKAYVPLVRANYPRTKVIVLGEPLASGVAEQPDGDLRTLVLEEAGHLADAIAINRYKGQWYDDADDQLANVFDSVRKIQHDLVELAQDCARANFKGKVALPEWNFWLHASLWDGKQFLEPDDAYHGLFVASMFHMLARLAPNIEVAAYEQLINPMGLIRNKGGVIAKTAISELFRLYRPALPARMVDWQIGDDGKTGEPLDVLVLRNDGGTWMFVINGSPRQSHFLKPENFSILPEECSQFAAISVEAPLHPREVDVDNRGIEFPPLSVTRLFVSYLA